MLSGIDHQPTPWTPLARSDVRLDWRDFAVDYGVFRPDDGTSLVECPVPLRVLQPLTYTVLNVPVAREQAVPFPLILIEPTCTLMLPPFARSHFITSFI